MSVSDSTYPRVDLDFLCDQILATDRVVDTLVLRSNIFYTIGGETRNDRRIVNLKITEDRTVNYNIASALAYRFKFLPVLLAWYSQHRNWKEGGYFQKHGNEE